MSRLLIEPVTPEEPGYIALKAESIASNFNMLRRLEESWQRGENRFNAPGEKLLGAFLNGKLVGVLGNSGQIDLNARFRGLLSSFDMRVGAKTDVGGIDCNLQMSPLRGGRSSVRGDVAARNLRLGELLGRRDLLGNATLTAFVDGVVGRGVTDANVVGNVTQLGFNGYVYDSLRLDGRLRNREFDGRITARDPNQIGRAHV